jgi:hypothetical protein
MTPSAKTMEARENARALFPVEFDDGARVGFTGHADGHRESGGYPTGFQTWALERRDAWFCGWNAGFHARKNSKGEH